MLNGADSLQLSAKSPSERERERERKGSIFSPYSLVNGKKCRECQQVNLTVLQLHSLCWEYWFLVSAIGVEQPWSHSLCRLLCRHWVGAV